MWQSALPASLQWYPGCIWKSTASRSRKVSVYLDLVLVKPHLEHQFWALQYDFAEYFLSVITVIRLHLIVDFRGLQFPSKNLQQS